MFLDPSLLAAAAGPGSASLLWPALISLVTSGAFVGILVALVKLPSDRAGAAVSQAGIANEALRETLEAVERDRDYWQRRWETCHKEKSDLYAELMQYRNERGSGGAA